MVYSVWDWGDAEGFDEVTVTVDIHNDIEYRDGRNGYYFIACTAFAIGEHGAYFGLQTAVSDPARGVTGKGAIFSRWYGGNEPWPVRRADTRIPEGGWTEAGDYEGDFVSVRGSYDWGEGQYTIRVAAEETDGIGRWFGLYVNDTWIGSLRFAPRAQIKPYCATPIELYGHAVKPSSIPYWKVSMKPPVGDGVAAELVKTYYPSSVESLQNALITVGNGMVTFEVGMDHIPEGRVDVDWWLGLDAGAISGQVSTVGERTAEGLAVSAWSLEDEETWVEAALDGTFEIQVPKGVYVLQIWEKKGDGVWYSAGWYDGQGGTVAERGHAFEVTVDGEDVQGIDISLPEPTPTPEETAVTHLAAAIPWLSDPPADHHSAAADMIVRAWLQDPDLAEAIAAMPWFADDLSDDDFRFLTTLLGFAALPNVQPALLAAAFTGIQSGDLRDHLLSSFSHTAVQSPERFDEVTGLPWVVDGLESEEAAFLVSLARLASSYPGSSAYPELQSKYFVQAESISLPLAGDVRVWVFQNTPIRPSEDLAGFIASSARIMEEFLGTPFPTTEVILLVMEDNSAYLARGSHYGHSMWITRAELDLPLVAHETAHYYIRGHPSWLGEGAAEFLSSYIAYKAGSQGLGEWRDALISGPWGTTCDSHYGFENLLHMSYRSSGAHSLCSYAMGEHFLLNVMETIGEQPLGAALGELSRARDWRNTVPEQQIYDRLLQHTPSTLREAFLEVYERLHGGPTLPVISDDHGGERSNATPLSVGQSVAGVLDYRFDLDFFSFMAEEGREYFLSIEHPALQPSSLGLYSTDGDFLARGVEQGASGLQMRWMAPTSGEHYVSVENFAGEAGTYTLTVTTQ